MNRRGHIRGRGLRLTAVAALVVLALTGFSTGRGHGGSGNGDSDGGGGGGCSSSGQDHDVSSSDSGGTTSSGSSGYHDYDKDDDEDDDTGDAGGSGSSSVTTSEPASVELVSCATADQPYATVEVTNPNDVPYDFAPFVYFLDENDSMLDSAQPTVNVPAHGTTSVRVAFDADAAGEAPDHCETEPTAQPEA
ncbi:hypothetical protein [Streptomyces sp. NPDC059894]|uniref:hypothetical protein n=1 Tax=unclassified Streptomyces TaxID=2593676 RepID=UPI003652D9F4